MSYTRMGTITATATVSMEPDRSGNFVCDGVADDVEIQAAINYVNTLGGGVVYILASPIDTPYLLSTTVYLRVGVMVWGEGIRATVIILTDGANCNMFEWSPTEDEYFAGLFNMLLDGNRANNVSGHCLFTTDADGGTPNDFHSARVWYNAAAEDGVHLDFAWGYKFTDCLFEGNARDGFYLNGLQTSVMGCFASLNGRHGINLGDDASYTYLAVYSGGNTEEGFHITGAQNYGFLKANGNGHDGIHIEGAHQCVFTISAQENSTAVPGTYYNLYLNATQTHIRGTCLQTVGSVAADIYVQGDRNMLWVTHDTIVYGWRGDTAIVNGHAANDGDPDIAGDWSGVTKPDGVVIRDYTNNITYVYDSRVAGNRYTI